MVVFIAIAAGKIAPAHGDEVREHGMSAGKQGSADEASLAQFQFKKLGFPHSGIDHSKRK
jgi:hypothetical protein